MEEGSKKMRVLVTGSTGLIGSSLVSSLAGHGHQVTRLVRGRLQPGAVSWEPDAGAIDAGALEGLDAAVHLAGESIAAGRWTAGKKRRILESRVKGTGLLAHALGRMHRPPECLISASAVGYYGDRGTEILNEDSPAGSGFLSRVCIEWERAAQPAAAHGIRLVLLRTGVVLSAAGGALPRMLLPVRLGLGGKLGGGKQYMSWIALEDLVDAIEYALHTRSLSGAVNGVAPNPVTNEDFTRTLARVVSRPALFALPAFAARLALGEMADELLLASTRVIPAALVRSGFRFRFSELEPALRHVLAS
jgi:uncharacterized protein (TIGR01777 family)